MRNDFAAARLLYSRDSVLSAPPARLLTMLYDRLLLDLQRAETALQAQDFTTSSKNLTHAQEIVAELMNSLRPELWDGGPGLLALYGYVLQVLVWANIKNDPVRTRECIELLEPLREAWHQAADQVILDSASGRRDVVA